MMQMWLWVVSGYKAHTKAVLQLQQSKFFPHVVLQGRHHMAVAFMFSDISVAVTCFVPF